MSTRRNDDLPDSSKPSSSRQHGRQHVLADCTAAAEMQFVPRCRASPSPDRSTYVSETRQALHIQLLHERPTTHVARLGSDIAPFVSHRVISGMMLTRYSPIALRWRQNACLPTCQKFPALNYTQF